MTSKIRVLDDDTINKIAAGEVIENPSSVVKELVENSIDAGSTEITIEIKGGGRQLIRITDNGCGMNNDDALLCLERHATSKLKEIDEIHAIGTMGFRGEAIPSIASISKFTLYTRVNAPEAAQKPGTLIIVNGGKVLTCSEVECAVGTTIEIKELFFNVPVRKKFQKSPSYDTAEIQRIVTQLALGNPKVNFQLFSNQEVLVSAPYIQAEATFSEALGERIRHLLGTEIFNSLVPLEGSKGDYQLEGFVGLPTAHRHNRSGQHLFINRRGVVVPLVSFGVRDGYGTMLPSGRHPLYVIHLSMPSELLDVNVHPQKREVRLRQERLLKELILFSVEKALQKSNFCFELSDEPSTEPATDFAANPRFPPDYSVKLPAWNPGLLDPFSPIEDSPPYLRPKFENLVPAPMPVEPVETLTAMSEPLLFAPPPTPTPEQFKRLKALGVLQKYIIATDAEGLPSELYLIDQRAAHARIIFEKLLDTKHERPHELQMLLIPHLLNLSSTEAAFLRGQLAPLQAAGILIKEFGPSSFMVEALPQIFGNVDIHKLIDEIVKCSYEGVDSNVIEREQKRKLAQAASRAAIASDACLSTIEAQQLLDQLVQCRHPKQCPSGKTTLIILTVSDIVRLGLK